MAAWWFWSHVVGTVLGAGLHDRVREWSAKASHGISRKVAEVKGHLL